MDLVSGQVHTNEVHCIAATPSRLYSLGLDKTLKSFEAANNEFRLGKYSGDPLEGHP